MRGLNNKVSFYKDFIASRKLGLIALLETHVKKENAIYIANFVAPRFKWVFNYDYHCNGRIWLGWDPQIWSISDFVYHSQHISCKVCTLDSKACFYASFVYAHNDYIERRSLWSDLSSFKSSFDDTNPSPWILSGDFNVCLNLDEISTAGSFSIDMREFQELVAVLDVFDLNYSGKFFTWWDCNVRSPTYKKLDRVLVNTDWTSMFSLSSAQFLARGLSDHSPSLINLGISGFHVPKPFQIFQHIIEHDQFLSTVEEAWNFQIQGDPWFILTSKLKRVKAALKKLNRNCGNLHTAVVDARTNLINFQTNLPDSPSADQFATEGQLCSKLQCAIDMEEVFLKQKSRVQWLDLGDGNNAFFHRHCKGRWNSNKIVMLQDIDGNEVSGHQGIAEIATSYFKHLLGTTHDVDSFDSTLNLPTLSTAQQGFLSTSFHEDDILHTFKRMAKRKSPGPDGLTPEFFLASWSIIGKDVSSGILHFFDSLHLPRIINSVALALVPKCSNPSRIEEYRPISCCNSIYKCIAKMLARRLQKVLPSIISPNQTAFVPNRIIGDNIMLVQSICKDYHRNDGIPRCSFKLDIHKAFDSINWDFMFKTLEKMLFPARFINWLRICITSCMISVKINGALEGFFPCKTGLRQGDPLSPYLFVICMEVMTVMLRTRIQDAPDFSFHWRTKQINLSHVIFADDIFLFCKGNSASIRILLDSVLSFSALSGLRLNSHKSQVFFCGVDDYTMRDTIQRYGFMRGTLPISYLGLPLITSRLNAQSCAPLIFRLCSKIESWTVRTLRYSGRLQLITSVLQGIQGYWSSFLFLPQGVLKKIQSVLAKFLWGGNLTENCHYKVAWSECSFPKSEGGLGVRDLFEWNRAAILFQVWRLAHTNPSSLWILCMHSCLLKKKGFWTAKIPYKCPWNARKILHHRQEALSHISCQIKADSDFKIWYDPWLINKPLIEHFGVGFVSVMDSSLDALVGSLISDGQWRVSTSNDYRALEFRRMLNNFSIGSSDKILWDGDSILKIRTVLESIRRRHAAQPWLKFVWHPFSIPACSFFSWLICRERLLTKDRMNHFGMAISNLKCELCRCYDESIKHIFSECPYTFVLLRASPYPLHICWNSWMNGVFFQDNLNGSQQNIGFLYINIVFYLLWKERNNRMHDKGSMRVEHTHLIIKRMFREKLYSCVRFRRLLARDHSISQILY